MRDNWVSSSVAARLQRTREAPVFRACGGGVAGKRATAEIQTSGPYKKGGDGVPMAH